MLNTEPNHYRNPEVLTHFNGNWQSLREEAVNLLEFRISTSTKEWYKEGWLTQRNIFEATEELDDSSDVNCFSKGVLAEIFFLNACENQGIQCYMTEGDEDAWGADFKILHNGEVRFVDVSVDASPKGIERKSSTTSFPTLFLPWFVNTNSLFQPQKRNISYAEKYVREGKFDSSEYIRQVLGINYEMLDHLKKYVWRGIKPGSRIFSEKEFSLKKAGIVYVNNLEGSLLLIRKSMGDRRC